MKVISLKHKTTSNPIPVLDCFIGDGYLKGGHGSLPDVDIDFESSKRQEVKEYYEHRYNHDGKQRVFSAGTFTTLIPCDFAHSSQLRADAVVLIINLG